MQVRNKQQIFLWPGILGVLTIAGLIVALVKDGLLEDVSLIALALPIIVIIYIYFFRNQII